MPQVHSTAAPCTDLEARALLAALDSPGHTLRRFNGDFIATPPRQRTSGTIATRNFTKRVVLRLHRDGLLRMDDIHCPAAATLTPEGHALAEQLRAHQGGA